MFAFLYRWFSVTRPLQPYLPAMLAFAAVLVFETSGIKLSGIPVQAIVFTALLVVLGRPETALMAFLPYLCTWLLFTRFAEHWSISFPAAWLTIPWLYYPARLASRYPVHIFRDKGFYIVTAVLTFAALCAFLVSPAEIAENPFICSYAGLIMTLLLSLVMIPFLYRILISDRIRKGLSPLTLADLLIGLFSFVIFLVTGQIFTIMLLIPLSGHRVRSAREKTLCMYARFFLFTLFNIRKKLINCKSGDFDKPAVVICNHQSFLDIPLMIMLSSKLIMLTTDWAKTSRFFRLLGRFSNFLPVSDGYEFNSDLLARKVRLGYSIMAFPEGMRSVTGKVTRFHKGAFLLAEKLDLDLLPFVTHISGDCLQPGSWYLKSGSVIIKRLGRISTADEHYGTTYQERSKAVRSLMVKEKEKLGEAFNTPRLCKNRLVRSYRFYYRGLVWLLRSELYKHDNFRFIHEHIPAKGLITEIGCGYGFLSYMLSLTGDGRRIQSVDPDPGKISLAAANFLACERTDFHVAAPTVWEPEESEGIILNLKALQKDEVIAIEVLKKCLEQLTEGGTLIMYGRIRDFVFFSGNKIANIASGTGCSYESTVQKTVRYDVLK
ncbi:MAG: 1-acyl-sn-glycerol-3-phosphate acyltransferase, partial [Bacteroidetes bacterium]|nr:1-acyl-sn-glycerol-3-phosphate acyltransferase [Bacteroidota bacterium]